MAVPTKDSSLAEFVPPFASTVSAAPASYGTTAAACTALTDASNNFVDALNAARQPGMKSMALTAIKQSSKAALLPLIRAMYAQIQANVTVSDEQKIALGIVVRKMPSPQPAPKAEPAVTIVSVRGRTVRLRFRDASSIAKRGKPPGVSSATILSYVGATPPADIAAWKFEANVSRTLVDVTFPADTAPGAQVWFTVFWSNRKDQSGPACAPIGTYLQPGSVSLPSTTEAASEAS